ncbi:MAG TPA: HAD domain-containing protein [Candidatus Acidoferrales bacterium]|nr:HAD domain-containing protein [Candidatus Acidoferrales bacterium]
MKIIFLDFHGVLFIPACAVTARLQGSAIKAWEPAVEALNRITETAGAKIVVTAPWRSSGIFQMHKLFAQWGLTTSCVDIVPDGDNRTDEIRKWFKLAATPETFENRLGHIQSFAILDVGSIYPPLHKYVVSPDVEQGLTQKEADKVIDLLDRPDHYYDSEKHLIANYY